MFNMYPASSPFLCPARKVVYYPLGVCEILSDATWGVRSLWRQVLYA